MNHKIKYVKTNFKNSVKNWKWSFKSNIKAIRNFLSPKNTINKGLTRILSHVKHLFFHVNYINFNIKYYDCICRKCFSNIQNIQKDLIVLPDDTLHLNRSNNGFYFVKSIVINGNGLSSVVSKRNEIFHSRMPFFSPFIHSIFLLDIYKTA